MKQLKFRLNRKYFVVVFSIVLILSCKNEYSDKNNIVGLYPSIIDSLGLQDLYDETKWRLYCLHCDDSVELFPERKMKETYGMLPIDFQGVKMTGNEIDLNFFFRYNDTLVIDFMNRSKNAKLKYGVKYIDRKFYCYETGSNFCIQTSDSTSRLNNCLQKDVVSYIKQNRNILNEWFVKEAIKRKVLE